MCWLNVFLNEADRSDRNAGSTLSCFFLFYFVFLLLLLLITTLSDRVNHSRVEREKRTLSTPSQYYLKMNYSKSGWKNVPGQSDLLFPLGLLPCGDVTSLALHTPVYTWLYFLHLFMKFKKDANPFFSRGVIYVQATEVLAEVAGDRSVPKLYQKAMLLLLLLLLRFTMIVANLV